MSVSWEVVLSGIAIVVSGGSAWIAWSSNRRTNLFQDAQWVVVSAQPRLGSDRATFRLVNRGQSVARDVELVADADPTGMLVPPASWPLIPQGPEGGGVFGTKVHTVAWPGYTSHDPRRRLVRVTWRSAANEARSATVPLPPEHEWSLEWGPSPFGDGREEERPMIIP